MIRNRMHNRRWNGHESHKVKALWVWIAVGAILATAIALMIASHGQPANASLDIWSTQMMAGDNGTTPMR